MVIAPNYMGDLHIDVIDNHGKVIRRRAVGPSDDQIVQLGILEHHPTPNLVMYHDLAFQRILETHHRIDADSGLSSNTAPAVVPDALPRFHLLFPKRRELFLRAIAPIGLTVVQPLVDYLSVTIKSLGLIERSLVGVQSQPGHAIQNRVDVFLCRPFSIRIFDAQDELSIMVPCVQPAIERSPYAPKMKYTGGAGCETCSDGHPIYPLIATEDSDPMMLPALALPSFGHNSSPATIDSAVHSSIGSGT
jgi:hypothetical protein